MKKENLFLVGGVLAGAAAGVLLGVLFAPDKGADTRKKIIDKGDDYLDDLKDKLDDFVKNMNEKMQEMKNVVTDYTGKDCKEKPAEEVKKTESVAT